FGEIELAAADPAPQVPASGDPSDATRAALTATRAQFEAFGALPATEQEVTYIGDAYAAFRPDEPPPVVLTGANATEAAVKALAAPPRVLHFATHGYYLASGTIQGRPLLQSGITLAGANRALSGRTGTDGENGILHAVEAQTLNLYGTELVVLSACDTGQGALDYSEGLEGLPRAFYVAGAQNVLAALWPVGDTAARDFMQRFYDIWLAQEISDPAAALRATKLWYITQTDPTKNNTQNWTPFVLFEG
ncbi:MAG: CHAT domain-containing protein, partial [Pseudomonadota bacterium]